MLAKLIRTLLGSEPCIRFKLDISCVRDRTEFIDALREGNQDGLFSFQYGPTWALIYPYRGNRGIEPPKPTVEYDPYAFTRTPL